MNEFKQTKIKFKHIFQDILGKDQSYELDEAAFPAYAHKNPLIDYLFWKRIQVAYDYGSKSESKQRVLDFGCGSGVLTYLLANEGHEVTSIDLEFGPLNRVKEKTQFPNGIRFLEGNIKTMGLPEKSFDLIYALDVLEHIDRVSSQSQK